jgi:hypothetical protein
LRQKSALFRELQEIESMNTFWQLWDTTTGNLVTEFDSEDEALESLCEVRAEDGDEALLEFALFRFQDGRPTLIAKGPALAEYVIRARKLEGTPFVKTT